MSILYQTSVTVAAPASEPLTLTEVKQQLGMPIADTTYDTKFTDLIVSVREQWESDTQALAIGRSVTENIPQFPSQYWRFYWRPVNSVTSITYYDTDNAQQTLDPSAYSVDLPNRKIFPAVGEVFPQVQERWDAVAITYDAGETVSIAKQAMLIQCDVYWEERGEGTKSKDNAQKAYEMLVTRYMRASYP